MSNEDGSKCQIKMGQKCQINMGFKMSNYSGSKNVKLVWVKIIGVKCVKLLWVHKCQITMGLKISNFWLGQILLGHPVVPLFYLEHQKSNDKSLWLLIHSTQEMSSWKTSARLLNKQ